MFQLLLKGCTIEAHHGIIFQGDLWVSVVVERMYDWSFLLTHETTTTKFQLLLKGCTIEAIWRILLSCAVRGFSCCWKDVRLKPEILVESLHVPLFQLLLKGCTIEAKDAQGNVKTTTRFSCCWKDVRLKRWQAKHLSCPCPCFSCCWKDVRLKLRNQLIENKWFLTVGFWSVFRKWSICTKSAIIFKNLGWFGWLLDCFW